MYNFNMRRRREKNRQIDHRKQQRQRNTFTLITKRIETAHTVISGNRNRVKVKKNKLRENYFNIFVCAKKKKQR